ncbi:MAG: hypothetical protein ABIW76_10335 [Fibrobacteria bacterium]
MPWKPIAIVFLLATGLVSAEPYIAVRTGFKCSQCHVNRTGGGKRTEFGEVYTQYKLLVASTLAQKNLNSFDPKLNNSVSLGANFRIEQAYLRQFTTKPANPGDSARMVEGNWNAGTFKEKNLYVEMDLIKDRLKLYYDKDMSAGGFRELWSMISLPANSYLKFGQMLLPYGYRLMDDDAFVRNFTGYTYSSTALAYEMGFEPGPLSLVSSITQTKWMSVGSFVFREVPVLRTVRLGGSYSKELTKEFKETKGSYGVFAGTTLGMFTILGERDYTKDEGIDKVEDYTEVDFLPMQGLNFKVTYESFWRNTAIPQAQSNQTRVVVGVEPFIMQFLQVGLYYRKNDWIPQSTADNQNQIVGRLHVFF